MARRRKRNREKYQLAPQPTQPKELPSSVQQVLDDRRSYQQDPARIVPGMSPGWGHVPIPHVVSFQGLLSTLAKVYRASDQALIDSWDNARYMRNDPMIMECVEQRQRSVALLDWHLEPEDEKDARQVELADELTTILEHAPRFMQYRECLMNGIWFGRYAVQQVFRPRVIEGQTRCCLTKWVPVHGDKLVFRYDDGSLEYDPDQVGIRVGAGFATSLQNKIGWSNEERFRKIQQADYGLAYFLDEWERQQLAVHKHIVEDGEFEDIYSAGRIHGVGIRHRIYWAWVQKQEALAWLMEFLERSAFGIEIWFYPWGDAKARDEMRTAAEERIGQGRNIILVPRPIGEEGMAYGVERIEPSMAGAEVLDKIIREFWGHQIKRYVLGQTLTTEAGSTGLGSNLASVHLDTYLQIVRYDATNLEETITTELIEPLKKANFPKLSSVPIRFKIDTESPDVEGKLKGCLDAYQMGARLKESDVLDLIGLDAPGEEDVALQSPEHRQQQALEQQAAQQRQVQGRGWRPSTPEEDAARLMQALGIQEAGTDGGSQPVGPPHPRGMGGRFRTKLGFESSEQAGGAFHKGHEGHPGHERKRFDGADAGRANPLQGGIGDQTSAASVDQEQLKKGIAEEMEHTRDPAIAADIALDHLTQDPSYYGEGSATPENAERKKVSQYAYDLSIRPGGASCERYAQDWDESKHPRVPEGEHGGEFTPAQERESHRLPERNLDTMSEAIAMSSPSGHQSERSKERDVKRLGEALFGQGGLKPPQGPEVDEVARLRQKAKELRALADRGMRPRAHRKQAEEWEAEADRLEARESDSPAVSGEFSSISSWLSGPAGSMQGVDQAAIDKAFAEWHPTSAEEILEVYRANGIDAKSILGAGIKSKKKLLDYLKYRVEVRLEGWQRTRFGKEGPKDIEFELQHPRDETGEFTEKTHSHRRIAELLKQKEAAQTIADEEHSTYDRYLKLLEGTAVKPREFEEWVKGYREAKEKPKQKEAD